ncbi:AEC family transporter [Sporolactobacillus laevolacticus]|uniref:AEC family transporter n=1 Tax=Sporolactobacillus laevolacticus TaxID=33018 RepID=UPI0025B2DD71|nr:AEC family transporter [Sporolactobacillus laevolacticus]MDN3954500.1 AEC family transporter [Sporolactobacillus laevolacticus]
MEFSTVLYQVFMIFTLMAVGFFAHKWNLIHESGAKDMTKILLYIVSPCVIILAFQQPFTIRRLHVLLISFICVVCIFLFSITASRLIFNGHLIKDEGRRNALKFSATYSNAGFMGIPLVNAVLGTQGVFYATTYLAGFNLFCWTHGIGLYGKKKDRKTIIKNMFNPNIIAVLVGLILFLFSLKLPLFLVTGLTYISHLNTPLSMIVIGDSIASLPLLSFFNDRGIWSGVIMRNLIVPAVAILLLHLTGISQTALLSVTLLSACPIAGIVVLFALLNDFDQTFPTKLMTVSTLLSVVTIPIVSLLALMLG